MATRADVARLAGVSASTVSYALSGERPISDETRRRIEAAMAELAYTPNAFARGLAGRRTGIIAVHLPFTERGLNLSEFEYLQAAAQQARVGGYHLLLWMNPADDLAELRRLAAQGLVDGVVLMEVATDDRRVGVLREVGMPFVLLGRTADDAEVSYVDSDFEGMAETAIDHLFGLGHRSVLFLSQSAALAAEGYGPTVRGQRGISAACESRGVELLVAHAAPTLSAGRGVFADQLLEPGRPTGVVSMNDQALIGIIGAAREHGLSVPADFSVVSVGAGVSTATLVEPPLTTVSPPAAEMGAQAVVDLLALVTGERTHRRRIISGALHVRGTSASAPHGHR